MRIALIPLDSRPPNRLFPQRLADLVSGIVLTPPREMLGSLHTGADGVALARWLRNTVTGAHGGPGCQIAVFSWDALLYGGLIQSRQLDVHPDFEQIESILREVDWRSVAGYCYATIPRLGISVTRSADWKHHAMVREYFINWGKRETHSPAAKRTAEIEEQLGKSAIDALWAWRARNLELARRALKLTFELGMNHCHIAVEDNAPVGPHLEEVEELRRVYLQAKREYPDAACTFFDGADEAACMLTAQAIANARAMEALAVQLTVHPKVPGPDRYTGLYESQNLGDGLTILGKILKLAYFYEEQAVHWMVVHGVQPQPDVFTESPAKVFSNPFLLPKQVPAGGRLHLSDLCACNGGNTQLIEHLSRLCPAGLRAATAYNTNFNTLGISAAWLRLARDQRHPANERFFLERLADDYAYQSIARPEVMRYLLTQGLDPLDFSDAHPMQISECLGLVRNRWLDWCEGSGSVILQAAEIAPARARNMQFSFPWMRAFEIEADAGQ